MAETFAVRQFKMDADVLPLLALRRQLGDDLSEDALRAQLAGPNQTPDQDRWIAESVEQPGLPLGQSFGFHTIPERYLVWVEVLPNWRLRGIGSQLLARAVERGHLLGADHILIYANNTDVSAKAFLEYHGFRPKSHAWFLSAPANVALPEPSWPDGYTGRSFDQVRDPKVLSDAHNRSYADMWGHGENSQTLQTTESIPEQWESSWLPEWDPTGRSIYLAFAPDGEVVGICRGELDTTEGQNAASTSPVYVDGPGVVLEHRVHQLQRPLVLSVMRWLNGQRPHASFELSSFGDDEQTVEIYRDIGFLSREHDIAYHFDL